MEAPEVSPRQLATGYPSPAMVCFVSTIPSYAVILRPVEILDPKGIQISGEAATGETLATPVTAVNLAQQALAVAHLAVALQPIMRSAIDIFNSSF